ncbi:MAG TPA: hypothetical protein EYN72_02395 [Dehalococcoidia bacterium]|jgi:hypothetical protein|nr:hypothetical protein [Dehalococcoidia bacterium]
MPRPDPSKRSQDPWLLDVLSYRRRVYDRSRSDAAILGWFFHLIWLGTVLPAKYLIGAWRKRRRAAQLRRVVFGPLTDDNPRQE